MSAVQYPQIAAEHLEHLSAKHPAKSQNVCPHLVHDTFKMFSITWSRADRKRASSPAAAAAVAFARATRASASSTIFFSATLVLAASYAENVASSHTAAMILALNGLDAHLCAPHASDANGHKTSPPRALNWLTSLPDSVRTCAPKHSRQSACAPEAHVTYSSSPVSRAVRHITHVCGVDMGVSRRPTRNPSRASMRRASGDARERGGETRRDETRRGDEK
jgi:hypothetical protein